MAVVVLSRKSLSARPLHEWLDDAARRVCLVTTRSALADGPPDVARRFRAVAAVEDYHSWEPELAAHALAVEHGAERIASSSEDDVIRAARLRGRLGLPGQDVASALACRDKVVMKRHVAAAGLRTPRFRAVDTPGDLLGFLADHGYPAVLKPRRGAGSRDVRVLRSASDVRAVLAAGVLPAAPDRSGRLLVESFVDGPFFHVDGVAARGAVRHCWPSRYSGGNAATVHDRAPLSSVLLDAGDPATPVLRAFTEAVVAALPPWPFPTSIHLEAWVPDDGAGPVFGEIASRTGGVSVADVYREARGVLLPRESLRAQCGDPHTEPARPEPERGAGWVALTPGRGAFHPPAEPCPVPGVRMEYLIEPGTVAPEVLQAGESAASVVVSGRDAAEVRGRIADTLGWWEGADPWR